MMPMTTYPMNFLYVQVIAEDVAAVIIHCGQMPQPAQPAHSLPAFPEAATTNHDANDDHILHETREFWGRLHPQSLVPLLQTALSKGKSPMPSSLMPDQNAQLSHPSWTAPKASPPNGTSHSNSHPKSHLGSVGFWGRKITSREGQSNPRDSLDSSRMGSQQDSSMHLSRGTTGESRTVHFDLPSSEGSDSNKENDSFRRDRRAQALQGREQAGAIIRKTSPPMDISFR